MGFLLPCPPTPGAGAQQVPLAPSPFPRICTSFFIYQSTFLPPHAHPLFLAQVHPPDHRCLRPHIFQPSTSPSALVLLPPSCPKMTTFARLLLSRLPPSILPLHARLPVPPRHQRNQTAPPFIAPTLLSGAAPTTSQKLPLLLPVNPHLLALQPTLVFRSKNIPVPQ